MFTDKTLQSSTSPVEEDDGYILTFLFNGRSNVTEFLVFDAQNIERGPVSRAELPVFVPYGLHCCFVPGLTFNL